jgi:hypothetical protein
MATLSGQTIQNTYQGLLKLDDSSQGVTSTLQPLQDGLGNNVGGAQYNNEVFKTTSNLYQTPYKFKYYGPGLNISFASLPAIYYDSIDNYVPNYYYDNGLYSYSAITFFPQVAAPIGELNLYEFAIYDATVSPTLGIIPNNRLTPVITLDTTQPFGFYTIPFPTNIKITTGIYFVVWHIWNNGLPPSYTLKAISTTSSLIRIPDSMLGFASDLSVPIRYLNSVGTSSQASNSWLKYLNIGLPSQYSEASLIAGKTDQTQIGGAAIGFLLNTVF